MAPRKKAADEASTPIPAPEVSGAPALPENPPEADEAPAADLAPEPEDEHAAALAALANDEVDETPAVTQVAPEASPEVSPEPAPAASPPSAEAVEIARLRRLLDAERGQHAADIAAMEEKVASVSHKPPPAPVHTKDPLREAKTFGVLATWKGPGTYGGAYYTLKGVRMPDATGVTTGYFPAACVDRFKDQFAKVD